MSNTSLQKRLDELSQGDRGQILPACSKCRTGARYIYGHGRVHNLCVICLRERNRSYQRGRGHAKHKRAAREWYRRTHQVTPDRYRRS